MDRESDAKFILTTFLVPGEGNRFTQTFLSYQATPRLNASVAYLWRTETPRLLGSYVFVPETKPIPSVKGGFAFSSAFESQVTPFVTTAKTFHLGGPGPEGPTHAQVYLGLSSRASEGHNHGLSGVKISPPGPFYLGLQHTGHDVNYYLGVVAGSTGSVSIWVGEGKNTGFLFSIWR